MKRISVLIAVLLILFSGNAFGQGYISGGGGGGVSFPAGCSNGETVVYNSTSGLWDTCASLAGGGDMLASVYVTSGKIKQAVGGTGIDTSGSTGTPYLTAGTWSVENAATMRTNLGLVIGTNVLAPDGDGSALTGLTASQLPDAAADGTTKGVATFNANDFSASSGVITIDYTNGQAASHTAKGFLTSADWDTFNAKAAAGQTFYIGTTQVAINRGTGALTLAGITLTTPDIGVATATSVNKVTITAPATGSTLTIADGKFFTVSNTLTLAGTDSSIITFPAASGTVAYAGTMTSTKICTANADGKTIDCNTETPTGLGTITAVGDITTGPAFTAAVPGKTLVWNNATSGTITLQAQTGALGTVTVGLPAASGTLVVGPANVPISIAGPSAARTITLSDNNFGISIASGKSLTLAGSLTTSGAYDVQFTIPGAYTYTFPGATKTLAASDASNLAVGSDARGDILIRGASAYGRLGVGTSGSVLTNNGTDPAWSTFFFSGTAAATYTLPGASKTLAASDASNLAVGSDARGDILIRGASAYGRLAIGASGKVLTTNGADPSWSAYTIAAPGAANAVLTSDGTNWVRTTSSANMISLLGSADYATARTNLGLAIGTNVQAYHAALASIAGLTETAGGMLYTTADNTYAVLALGSTGKLLRAGAAAPAYSTLTMPDTIAAGSVFAANSANVLAEINSTTGTKFLQNASGTISWATGVGTIGGSTGSTDNVILTADGTGGVTLQANPGGATISDAGLLTITSISAGTGTFTVSSAGAVVAASLTITKATGTAGDFGLYEANSTDTDAAGLRGPTSMTANTSYRGQFPTARPTTGTRNALVWTGTAGSGDGTPTSPYIHAMSFVDLDTTFAALAGATFTGKVTFPVVSGANEGINIGQSSGPPSGTPANGAMWITASGLYAQIAGATVGPFSTGAPAFSAITSGTNTNALVIGNGGSLGATGTGTIAATSVTNATLTTALTVNTGAVTLAGQAGGSSVTLPASGTLATVTAPIALASQAAGDIFYATSGTAIARLAKGTAYQILHMNSGATAPEWTSTLGATGTRLTAGYFASLTAAGGTIDGVNAASGSLDALTLSGTLGAFNGSDTFRSIYLNYTNANHTGTGNTVALIDIAAITGDENSNLYGIRIGNLTGTTGAAGEVEYAINIGTGWDYGIYSGSSINIAGAVIAGGTNTFNITNGTASLDVAAGAAVNIDTGLTVQTGAVTLTGNASGSTLVLPSGSLTLGTMAAETATNYVTKALYDANSILYATTDDTPAALTVGASTIVGRKASGNIVALTPSEAATILNLGQVIDAHAGSTTITLVPGICPVIHNASQAAANVNNALPALAEGLCFVAQVRTAQAANYWRLTAETADTICLDGTCSKDYVQFAAPAVTDSFTCLSAGTAWHCNTVRGTATTD